MARRRAGHLPTTLMLGGVDELMRGTEDAGCCVNKRQNAGDQVKHALGTLWNVKREGLGRVLV